MATDIVPDAPSGADPVTTALDEASSPPKYTPEDHQKASGLKIARLVELGANGFDKTATFEFAGGFIRSIDIDAQTIWHPLLAGIDGADWHRLLEHVAPRSKGSDGAIVVQNGPMYFWTHRFTRRGRHLSSDFFDVPHEGYFEGRLTGSKAARELILFLQRYERARGPGRLRSLEGEIAECLQRAFALARDRAPRTPNQGHAAFVFCELVTRYFVAGSATANPAYLDSQVSSEERSIAWLQKQDENAHLEMAERMRLVRAAKAAKRGGSVEMTAAQAA